MDRPANVIAADIAAWDMIALVGDNAQGIMPLAQVRAAQ
jgi:hypothetical protein